jgi:hypothetical protein
LHCFVRQGAQELWQFEPFGKRQAVFDKVKSIKDRGKKAVAVEAKKLVLDAQVRQRVTVCHSPITIQFDLSHCL